MKRHLKATLKHLHWGVLMQQQLFSLFGLFRYYKLYLCADGVTAEVPGFNAIFLMLQSFSDALALARLSESKLTVRRLQVQIQEFSLSV